MAIRAQDGPPALHGLGQFEVASLPEEACFQEDDGHVGVGLKHLESPCVFQDGRSLAELARDASVLVVFLRHFG